jgi:very-short-patch-repair endonuclease
MPYIHLDGCGCPKCGVTLSIAENEIFEYCKQLCHDAEQSNRSIIHPYEIDIYIPSKKIGIEYNGILWHSEKYKKDKNYHLEKLNLCKEKGVKLIQIFEDEYVNSKDIVLNKIKHLVGASENLPKIMGRKCEIKEIDNGLAKSFLNKYHIQGYGPSTINIGAFFNDLLIAVMSFKKETKESNRWELSRFASDYNYICQGVGGKLFKYFVREYDPDVIKSFADRRWTINEESNVYTKLGYIFDGYTEPDYKYFNPSDGIKRQHKFGFRIKLLNHKYGLPLSMTESEMTKQLGYEKIYDCGLIRYIWKKAD